MTISMEQRFAVNAALERLTADGDTFDPADARLVIEAVPVAKGNDSVGVSYDPGPSKGAEGYAAGFGNVGTGGEKREKLELGNERASARIGGYKLRHTKGRVRITLMWAKTKLDENGEPEDGMEASLYYNRFTGRPLSLKQAMTHKVALVWPWPRLRIALGIRRNIPWKVPADGVQAD